MPQRFEGQFAGFDESELFFQTWSPDHIRGVLILTHGLAEHSECYHPLAKALADDGWLVYAWDMRGHGRSEGKRGYVRSISDYIEDLARFHTLVSSRHRDTNLVLFGHSLGGLITLRFVQRDHPAGISALALSSPCVGLSVAVPKMKERLAHLAVKWAPKLTLYNEIKYEDLTHDEEMLKSYRADTLRHDKISPGLFLSMIENFPLVLQEAEVITQPVLMQLAGDDRIVSLQASRDLFEHLPNKKNQLLVYPESFHEVFNDLDREAATADLKKFLNSYLGA